MEKSFDLGALLRNNQMKHKVKPAQFVSVAHGVQKRLEYNIKNRRSSRLTLFDRTRNITACESTVNKSAVHLKLEHRKQQLEKWKEEKAKKKKEQAAKKKKPFLVGVPSAPMMFVGPPPVPTPSTSGRVTRSQAAKRNNKDKECSLKQKNTESFAPINASFQPPKIRSTYGISKLLTLAPVIRPIKSNTRKTNALTFNPILPNTTAKTVKQTRSKTVLNRKTVTEVKKPIKSLETMNVRSKIFNKPPPKTTKVMNFQSNSSSSDIELNNIIQSSSSGSDIVTSKKSSNFTQTSIKYNRKSSGSTKTIVHQNSSGSDSPAKSKSASKTVVYDLTSPEEQYIRTKTSKRIQTPGAGRTLMRNAKQATKKIMLSTSSESDFDSAQSARRKSSRPSLNHMHNSSDTLSSESKSSTNSGIISIASGSVEIVSAVNKETPIKSLPSTPNLSVPKSESSSEQKLRSPKSPLTPEQMDLARKISPCVTLSRGKDNARKEMKWKLDEGLLDGESSDVVDVGPERAQLDAEVERLSARCAAWEEISTQTVLPEPAQAEVLSVLGKARLLITQKLQQYRGLVDRCARPERSAPASPSAPTTASDPLVTRADLQGFWDMVYLQVQDVDKRFENLEEWRARGWAGDEPVEVEQRAASGSVARAARVGSKPSVGTKPGVAKPAASSRLREMMAASRKAMATKTAEQTAEPSPAEPEKTFEGGFFSVRSPVRSPRPAPSTPRPRSLRKAVVSSEASKNAINAILRSSVKGKCEDFTPLQLTPIDLNATPGRSILKSAKSSKKSANKSIKVVLFRSNLDNSFTSAVSDQDKTINNSGETPIDGVEEFDKECHVDSVVSAIGESNVDRRCVLVRQDAVDVTPSTRQRHSGHVTPINKSLHKNQADIEIEIDKHDAETVEDVGTTSETSKVKKDIDKGILTKKGQGRKKTIVKDEEVANEDIVERKVAVTKRKKSTGNMRTTDTQEENTPSRRTTRSTKKAAVQKEEAALTQNYADQEDLTTVELKTSSRRKSTRKTDVQKNDDDADEIAKEFVDQKKATRNTKSRRSIVIQEIKVNIVLQEDSVQSTEVNEEEGDSVEEKTTRKSVLKEKENVMEDVTPRKSSAKRRSTAKKM